MLSGFDWGRIAPAAVWSAIITVILILLRGQIARLIVKLLREDQSHTLDLMLDTFDTKKGRTSLRALIDDIYADRIKRNEEFYQVALANRDKLDAIGAAQHAQGSAIREMEGKMGELPRLSEAIEKMAEATQQISEEMAKVNISMARIDEREKERERRYHDDPGNRHQRRESDR